MFLILFWIFFFVICPFFFFPFLLFFPFRFFSWWRLLLLILSSFFFFFFFVFLCVVFWVSCVLCFFFEFFWAYFCFFWFGLFDIVFVFCPCVFFAPFALLCVVWWSLLLNPYFCLFHHRSSSSRSDTRRVLSLPQEYKESVLYDVRWTFAQESFRKLLKLPLVVRWRDIIKADFDAHFGRNL